MKVIEYFNRMNKFDSVTFIKARARKDANTKFYHFEYQTTPVHTVEQWEQYGRLNEYIILNDNQPQIQWANNAGIRSVKCMLIVNEKDFAQIYRSEEQRQQIIESIDKTING